MERRDNFLWPPSVAAAGKSLPIPTAGDAATNLTSSSGSSSSLTLSPPDFLRQVHAAFKRQRPLGSMQSNLPRATRVLVPRGEEPRKAGASPSVAQNPEEKVMKQQRGALGASRLQNVAPHQKKIGPAIGVLASSQDESLLTTPSMLGTITDTCDQNVGQDYQQKSEIDLLVDRKKSSFEISSSQMASRNALVGGGFKKDQFYSVGDAQLTSHSDNVGVTVDSRMDSMLSYLHSVSLTAGDNFHPAQVAHDQGRNHQELEIADAAVEMDIKYDAANVSQRGIEEACNQNHGEPMTHCSGIGSSVTAASLHSGPTVQSTRVSHTDSGNCYMAWLEHGLWLQWAGPNYKVRRGESIGRVQIRFSGHRKRASKIWNTAGSLLLPPAAAFSNLCSSSLIPSLSSLLPGLDLCIPVQLIVPTSNPPHFVSPLLCILCWILILKLLS